MLDTNRCAVLRYIEYLLVTLCSLTELRNIVAYIMGARQEGIDIGVLTGSKAKTCQSLHGCCLGI